MPKGKKLVKATRKNEVKNIRIVAGIALKSRCRRITRVMLYLHDWGGHSLNKSTHVHAKSSFWGPGERD